ncbi:hypothetical protein STEG23_022715 [Scotinomys teguina]
MGPVMPASKKPESSGISVSSGLSHCYRGSGFSKALQEDDDLDFPLPDIRLEEGTMEDEELTNLNWLHESKNLLKSFGESVLRSVSPVQDLDDDTPPSPAHSDMPYDARQNPNCKPPYSFSCLIFMAIEDSPTKRLPVKDIYNWILEHFPYFANAPTGWKNSVRHNLSLNKCFKKVDKERSQCSDLIKHLVSRLSQEKMQLSFGFVSQRASEEIDSPFLSLMSKTFLLLVSITATLAMVSSEDTTCAGMGPLEFEFIKALIVFDSGADLMLTYLNNEMQIAIFPGMPFPDDPSSQMPAVLDLLVVCSSNRVWKAVSGRVSRQQNSGTEPGQGGDEEKPGSSAGPATY